MASRYEKEDSKRRILSACVQLFLEKGYQKTTTVEILKKAGVTPSTFYNIYHTREYFNRTYRIYVWQPI